MESANFPWRPLGALLVAQDLLSPEELEEALAEQRRSGRLLGEILVDRGWLGAFSLARVLAEQHGVELRAPASAEDASAASPAEEPARPGQQWRPLGALLVEGGWLGRAELERTLAAQHSSGRRLGEILVDGGYLTGAELARVLAQQQGVDLPAIDVAAVVMHAAPGGPTFRVCEAVLEPSYRRLTVLFESANFLEAADFAFELVEKQQPGAFALERRHAGSHEIVWTYSKALADEHAAGRTDLVGTFGFDPTKWDGAAYPR